MKTFALIIFIVLTLGCNNNNDKYEQKINELSNKITNLEIELKQQKESIFILSVKDSFKMEYIQSLGHQDGRTLDIIANHLKYNHGFEISK